jgi:hypothetical protein
MKDSAILRYAHKRIALERDYFVCRAIRNTRGPIEQKAKLIGWVMKMLNGFPTYSEWMRSRHRKEACIMTPENYKQGRLQWLDWMITECEREEVNGK